MLPYLKMLGTTPLPSTQNLEVQGLLPLPSLTSHRKVCRTLGPPELGHYSCVTLASATRLLPEPPLSCLGLGVG